MTCPVCGQSASSYHRFLFTIQGVSLGQSLRGYLRCQNCDVLLRMTRIQRFIWLQVVLAATFVALYASFASRITDLLGVGYAKIALIPLLLLVGCIATYLFWRSADVEKIEP